GAGAPRPLSPVAAWWPAYSTRKKSAERASELPIPAKVAAPSGPSSWIAPTPRTTPLKPARTKPACGRPLEEVRDVLAAMAKESQGTEAGTQNCSEPANARLVRLLAGAARAHAGAIRASRRVPALSGRRRSRGRPGRAPAE